MNINTDIAAELIDWYWQYGSMRSGAYALSRGGWLGDALRMLNEAKAVKDAQTIYSKPTMALWGPSQSGKSTLLAEFIDANALEDGTNSALHWNAPARFCGDNKGGEVAVLNPYNQGADASGCVTRFQMRSEIPYPECPVEVQFATQQEILLSLAVGYLSETAAKTAEGEVRHWTPSDLPEIIKIAVKDSKSKEPDKAAFKLLIEVLNVVDTLIDIESPRYVNLQSEWASRRADLLNNNALVSNIECVQRFAAELLWDSWPNMSALYARLFERCDQLGGKKYYCTVEMAALLLNISAAALYSASDYVKNLVDSCTAQPLSNGDISLVRGSGGFFSGEIDFAIAQGLVSLIVVPLKEEVIRSSHPELYNLLQKADLVDFPGVANEHKSADPIADEKISLEYRTPEGKRPLLGLTQVMKRGKTASIVISSSRNLNIDAFSLLVRMPAGQQYPAQPTQLMNGIRHWFKSMGQRHNPLDTSGTLPINLILTFSASLLNMVHASGTGLDGLSGVFNKLTGLGDLAKPNIVTTFCVNYPKFSDGEIHIDSDDRKKEVVKMILEDRHFSKLFERTKATLREMADMSDGSYGGRSFLFRKMHEQLQSSQRPALLAAKTSNLLSEWNARMAEALPGAEDGAGTRLQDIDKMCKSILETSLSAKEMAQKILDFEDLKPEVLHIIPRRTEQMRTYVESQVQLWMEESKKRPLQTELGFENQEHRTRVLSYLCENVQGKELEEWLSKLDRKRLGSEERRECRRLVATFLMNQIFPTECAHKSEHACVNVLNDLAASEAQWDRDLEQDPFYLSVTVPFLNVLENVKTPKNSHERGVQPGDAELQVLLSK